MVKIRPVFLASGDKIVRDGEAVEVSGVRKMTESRYAVYALDGRIFSVPNAPVEAVLR